MRFASYVWAFTYLLRLNYVICAFSCLYMTVGPYGGGLHRIPFYIGRGCAFVCIKGHMIECDMFLFVVPLFVHLFVFLQFSAFLVL